MTDPSGPQPAPAAPPPEDARGDGSGPEVLEALTARLGELEGAPVAAHPDVLEQVHTGLVAELGELPGTGQQGSPDGSARRR